MTEREKLAVDRFFRVLRELRGTFDHRLQSRRDKYGFIRQQTTGMCPLYAVAARVAPEARVDKLHFNDALGAGRCLGITQGTSALIAYASDARLRRWGDWAPGATRALVKRYYERLVRALDLDE